MPRGIITNISYRTSLIFKIGVFVSFQALNPAFSQDCNMRQYNSYVENFTLSDIKPIEGFVRFIEENDYYYHNCNHSKSGTTIPFDRRGNFRAECAPDILYSWQESDQEYLNSFSTSPLNSGEYLYTWRTPMGTFGYGDTQVRMKLKGDVEFKLIDMDERDCRRFPQEEKDNTIYVIIVHDYGSEYLLCSKNVLESWSRDTYGAQVESIKELLYIEANAHPTDQTYDIYLTNNRRRRSFTIGIDSFIERNELQRYFPSLVVDTPASQWTTESLQRNLDNFQSKNSGDQTIYYNEGFEGGHYESSVPSPFRLSREEIDNLGL